MAKKAGTMSEETKSVVDGKLVELGKQMTAFDARISMPSRSPCRRGGTGGGEIELKTLGQHLADSDGYQADQGAGQPVPPVRYRHSVETKAMLTVPGVTGSTTSLTNSLITADRRPIVNLPDRTPARPRLFTPGQTTSNSIEYPVETLFTNAAAIVAEGAKKPESTLAFDMKKRAGQDDRAPVQGLAPAARRRGRSRLLHRRPRARFGLRFAEEACSSTATAPAATSSA